MSPIRIGFLNLPDPPESLRNTLIDICKEIEISESSLEWTRNFHRNEINIAGLEYGNPNVNGKISKELQIEIRRVYGDFFDGDLMGGTMGKIKNVSTGPSQVPPHCDRGRYVAINYLLELGGSDVQTVFYKKYRTTDISEAENFFYKDVDVDFKIRLPQNKWHAFSVAQCHGVENIMTERYIFSLILKSNPKFEDFVRKYDNLLDHAYTI